MQVIFWWPSHPLIQVQSCTHLAHWTCQILWQTHGTMHLLQLSAKVSIVTRTHLILAREGHGDGAQLAVDLQLKLRK